jgi:hypothetical protein
LAGVSSVLEDDANNNTAVSERLTRSFLADLNRSEEVQLLDTAAHKIWELSTGAVRSPLFTTNKVLFTRDATAVS